MPSFKVSVIIENKPEINDPEGETILHDLVLKGNNSSVKKITLTQSNNKNIHETQKSYNRSITITFTVGVYVALIYGLIPGTMETIPPSKVP